MSDEEIAVAEGQPSQDPWSPSMEQLPAHERFLQQALGTQGDVGLPAMLLSVTVLVAVVVVWWKKRRRKARPTAGDDE